MGFQIWGFGFRDSDFRFQILDLACRVSGLRLESGARTQKENPKTPLTHIGLRLGFAFWVLGCRRKPLLPADFAFGCGAFGFGPLL